MEILNHTHGIKNSDLFRHGVYKLYHISNIELIYVGSCSDKKGFHKRFAKHIWELSKGSHHCRELIKVTQQYGIDGFRFEILEFTSIDNSKYIEQKYLDKLKPFYNTAKGSRGNLKGEGLPQRVYDENMKKIDKYTIDGIFIETYKSIQIAANENKIDRSSISTCASGKRKTAGGFIWKFTN